MQWKDWYFYIVDVVAVLTERPAPQTYWWVLKKRLKDEGNESVTNCNALKMITKEGKMDITNTERIDEAIDLEFVIERAVETYLKKGYSEEWVLSTDTFYLCTQ